QDAVGEEERDRPPAVPDQPERGAQGAEEQDQAEPDDRVADGGVVGAPHQLLHPLARHGAAEPRPARQPGVHRRLVLRTRQAIPRQPLPPRVGAVHVNVALASAALASAALASAALASAALASAARVSAARSDTAHALPPPRQTPTTPNAHHTGCSPHRMLTTPDAHQPNAATSTL